MESSNQVPDGDTLGRFRNLLVRNGIQDKLFAQVVKLLQERGLLLKKGTIVDTSCPLCAVNMTECVGKEPEPSAPVESEQPDTDPEPEKKAGGDGLLLVVLVVALAGCEQTMRVYQFSPHKGPFSAI